MKYIHFEQDGVRQAFPVSRHLLRVGAPLPAMRAWRPSLLQQGASFALMLALCASSYGITYGNLDNTLSYFRDTEVSQGNVLAAAALFFNLNPGEVTESIERGGTVPISMLMTPGDETAPLMYRVTTEEPAELAGTQPLCSLLTASGTTPFLYNGPLLGINTEATTTPGRWNVDVSLPEADGMFSGAECTVHFVYRAWHKDSPEGTGYTDEKHDSFTFVFNEPEPDGEHENETVKLLEESPLDTAGTGDDTSGDEPPVPDETTPTEPAEKAKDIEPEGANEEEIIEEEPAPTEPADTETPPVPPTPPADTGSTPADTSEPQAE